MGIQVAFCISLGEDVCVSEGQLTDHQEKIAGLKVLEGVVTIQVPDQPPLEVEDELAATIQNLCFDAVKKLLAGKKAVVPYFSSAGSIRLSPQDDVVMIAGVISSEGYCVPPVSVPRPEIPAALYGCGSRYIQFLRQLAPLSINHRSTVEWLEPKARLTYQALTAAGYQITE